VAKNWPKLGQKNGPKLNVIAISQPSDTTLRNVINVIGVAKITRWWIRRGIPNQFKLAKDLIK
jgi:hypothetical protein